MDLKKLNVQSLNEKEMKKTNGGVLPALWAIMVAIDLGLIGVYATYDANGKLKH